MKFQSFLFLVIAAFSLSAQASQSAMHSQSYPIPFADSQLNIIMDEHVFKQNLYDNVLFDARSRLSFIGTAALNNGVLKVTDTLPILKGFPDYINLLNREMSREVMFKVEIFNVPKTGNDVGNSIWVVDNFQNKEWGGLHKLSPFIKSNTTTSNYQPVTFSNLQKHHYISSVRQTSDSHAVQYGEVSSGIAMTLLPRLVSGTNTMRLGVYVTVGSTPDFKKETIDHQTIEMPSFNLLNVNADLVVKTGQSIIIKRFWEKQFSNEGVVMVITPVVTAVSE